MFFISIFCETVSLLKGELKLNASKHIMFWKWLRGKAKPRRLKSKAHRWWAETEWFIEVKQSLVVWSPRHRGPQWHCTVWWNICSCIFQSYRTFCNGSNFQSHSYFLQRKLVLAIWDSLQVFHELQAKPCSLESKAQGAPVALHCLVKYLQLHFSKLPYVLQRKQFSKSQLLLATEISACNMRFSSGVSWASYF